MINNKEFERVGVISVGGYVPRDRISIKEIAQARGKDGDKIMASLGVRQKAVAQRDEDTASLAVAAASRAIIRKKKTVRVDELGAVVVGSESHPYAVKPTGSMVADMLGMRGEYITSDLEFACKAATTGMIYVASMIEAGVIENGLVIGADVAQSKRGDVLEFTAGAGAAAVWLGNKKYPWVVRLERMNSFNSDTPDFWRREGEKYPQHAGRFTGEPAYFKHVVEGTEKFLKKINKKTAEFDQVVLHMPNGKFPQRAAKKLGVTTEQLQKGLVVEEIGNPYSASSLLGLVKVIEEGKKGERVLMTSYGSGAGSDSFSFEILRSGKEDEWSLSKQLKEIKQLSYVDYLNQTRKEQQ